MTAVCKGRSFDAREPSIRQSHQLSRPSEVLPTAKKSSPNRAELRTFKLSFSFQHLQARQRLKVKGRKAYRSPVALAREWRAILGSGQCSSAAELARRLGVSRARVTQVLRLLRLSPGVLERITALRDPMFRPIVTEHGLRPIVDLPPAKQRRWIEAKLATSL